MSIIPKFIRGGGYMTPKGGGATSQVDMPGDVHLALAKVGSGESELWARVEGRKAFVSVTYQTGPSGDGAEVEVSPAWLGELKIGTVLLLGLVNADPNHAYVIGRVDVVGDGLPESVCGVLTNVELASELGDIPPMAPLPLWTWAKTGEGRLAALQTGAGGDVLVHSGAGMEVVADTVQIKGKVVIGSGFLTPPVGRMAGVEDIDGGEVAGVPGVAQPENPIGTATEPPYVGDQDAVIRAKDRFQATAGTDAAWFAWIARLGVYLTALDVYLAIVAGLNPVAIAAGKLIFDAVPKPGLPPLTITSEAMSASAVLRVADSVAE